MECVRQTAARFAGAFAALGKLRVLWAQGFGSEDLLQFSRDLLSFHPLSLLFPLHGSEAF